MSRTDGDESLWGALQFPYGYPDAIDKLGTTTAPLLAGFAFTLIGLTLANRASLGEPDLSLLLLVASSVALISAVQLNFNARKNYFSPGEYFDLRRLAAGDGVPMHAVKEEARRSLIARRRWARYSRVAYNLGVTLIFFGVAATLIPTAGLWNMAPLRALAVGLLAVTGIVEAVLMTRDGADSLKLEIAERRA